MTEISEMSVEDELRDELRRVRHDLEHVVQERDAAKKHNAQLLGRIARVRRIRDEIPCANCDHPAKHHDDGHCATQRQDSMFPDCRCSWGRGDLAESIDDALGEQ